MSDVHLYPVPEHFKAGAAINLERYRAMYAESVNSPDTFWAEQAKQFLTWQQPWTQVTKSDLRKGEVAWFIGGKLNVSVNCIDRHLPQRANQTAIIWEGEPGDSRSITYRELHQEVCKTANALASLGVTKGDRVAIYMGMVPELPMAMLAACEGTRADGPSAGAGRLDGRSALSLRRRPWRTPSNNSGC